MHLRGLCLASGIFPALYRLAENDYQVLRWGFDFLSLS